MSESIVQKETPVQSNPFAKHLADHVNAGAVAIESERAIAEAQGKLVIAKRFPRDQARAYSAIIDACKRPGLAEEACYSFPRGGQTVSGPSIRLAEMLAANWGNIDYGIRELSRKEGVSEMEAYCWDLETNTMSSQKFTVRHIRDTRGGGVKLTDERDIYDLTATLGGRRLRARILAIIPADLVQAAVDECSKTMAGGAELPIGDRIRNMVTAFKTLGVQAALIEKRVGHGLDSMTGEELGDLRKIHNSIRDGVSKIGDWFGDKQSGDDEAMPGDPAPKVDRPKAPPRATKGVASVAENAAPAAKPADATVVEAEIVAPAPAPVPAAVSHPESKAVEPAPKPAEPVAAEKPAPRAFLKDGEEITAVCEVVQVDPMLITATVNGVKAPQPSAALKLKGGYEGVAYHIGGGTQNGTAVTPLPVWVVGSSVSVKLRGKLNTNPKVNKVQVFVDAVEAVNAVGEMEA